MPETYGYIFAGGDREEKKHLDTLHKLSIPDKNIFIDRKTRTKERPMFNKMKGRLEENDLLYIKTLDWLGNNYEEIMEQWRLLTHDKRIDVVVLDLPLVDTRRDKNIQGQFLSETVTELLAYVAHNDQMRRKNSQQEGIEHAKENGVQFGRPKIPLPDNFDEVYHEWITRKITGVEAARRCGMPLSTFRHKAQHYQKEE